MHFFEPNLVLLEVRFKALLLQLEEVRAHLASERGALLGVIGGFQVGDQRWPLLGFLEIALGDDLGRHFVTAGAVLVRLIK